MQRCRATKGDQRELADIERAFGNITFAGGNHRFIHHGEYAPGRIDCSFIERFADLLQDRLFRRGAVELHVAAEKTRRIDISEHDIGIGHGRVRTAAPVTGRPRLRAGALRPDLEKAQLIDVRDAAAAGADFDQLDHRNQQRQSAAALEAPRARGFKGVGAERLAVFDATELGRGAAHVEGQHAVDAEQVGISRCGQRAGRRPRFDQLNRDFLRNARARNAAIGEHDVHMFAETAFTEFVVECGEILFDARTHVGVEHRR